MWFPVPTTSSPSKRLVPRLRHHRETHEIQQSAICLLKISNSLRELHLPPYGRKTNPSCFPDGELPYHTILNHTILYYTILYYIQLYRTIPYFIVATCPHPDLPFNKFTCEFFNSKSTKIDSELAEANFLSFPIRN